jgi:hypothetical protein
LILFFEPPTSVLYKVQGVRTACFAVNYHCRSAARTNLAEKRLDLKSRLKFAKNRCNLTEDGLNRGMECGKTATICEFVNAFG